MCDNYVYIDGSSIPPYVGSRENVKRLYDKLVSFVLDGADVLGRPAVKWCAKNSLCCGLSRLMCYIEAEEPAEVRCCTEVEEVEGSHNRKKRRLNRPNIKLAESSHSRYLRSIEEAYVVLISVLRFGHILANGSGGYALAAQIFFMHFAVVPFTNSSGTGKRFRIRNLQIEGLCGEVSYDNGAKFNCLCNHCIGSLVGMTGYVSKKMCEIFIDSLVRDIPEYPDNSARFRGCFGSRGSFAVNDVFVHGWVPCLIRHRHLLRVGAKVSIFKPYLERFMPTVNHNTVKNKTGGAIRLFLRRGCVLLGHSNTVEDNVLLACKGWPGLSVKRSRDTMSVDRCMLLHEHHVMVSEIEDNILGFLRERLTALTHLSCPGTTPAGVKDGATGQDPDWQVSRVGKQNVAGIIQICEARLREACPVLREFARSTEAFLSAKVEMVRDRYRMCFILGLVKNAFENNMKKVNEFPRTDLPPEAIKLLNDQGHRCVVGVFPLGPNGMWLNLQPEATAGYRDISKEPEEAPAGSSNICSDDTAVFSHHTTIDYVGKCKPNHKAINQDIEDNRKSEGVWIFVPLGSILFLPPTMLYNDCFQTDVFGNPRGYMMAVLELQEQYSIATTYRAVSWCLNQNSAEVGRDATGRCLSETECERLIARWCVKEPKPKEAGGCNGCTTEVHELFAKTFSI